MDLTRPLAALEELFPDGVAVAGAAPETLDGPLFAEEEAVIGGVDDDGIFGQSERVKLVEQAADQSIDKANGRVISVLESPPLESG